MTVFGKGLKTLSQLNGHTITLFNNFKLDFEIRTYVAVQSIGKAEITQVVTKGY